MRPQLKQLNVLSGDLSKSLAFYRLLGVDIPAQAVWSTESGEHHAQAAEASTGPLMLEFDSTRFATFWNSGWQDVDGLEGRIVLGFAVAEREDVDALYDKVTASGHQGLQVPYDAFWGARFAVVEDPDGIAVGIMSPPLQEHRRPPPAGV